eukprot:164646-Pyramimonas_sp.AAC.1
MDGCSSQLTDAAKRQKSLMGLTFKLLRSTIGSMIGLLTRRALQRAFQSAPRGKRKQRGPNYNRPHIALHQKLANLCPEGVGRGGGG